MEPAWFVVGLAVSVPFVGLSTWLFQWLWNTTIPELFRLPVIRYWQALRLLVIAAFLFGGGSLVSMGVSH
jgi:hypothetical protein